MMHRGYHATHSHPCDRRSLMPTAGSGPYYSDKAVLAHELRDSAAEIGRSAVGVRTREALLAAAHLRDNLVAAAQLLRLVRQDLQVVPIVGRRPRLLQADQEFSQ